ncbi:MAG: hypothetical protein ACKVP7_06445 [Hyphomicrobiaceae bacterium]
MGIENLNKAVLAAGFAMAAPDEDTLSELRALPLRGEVIGRGIVPVVQTGSETGTWHAVRTQAVALATWMRSITPSFGGRAPA